MPSEIAGMQPKPPRQVSALAGTLLAQSSSLPHSAEHRAGPLPTCRQRPPAQSSAGLEIVTSPVDVEPPRSQGAPTDAGEGGQPVAVSSSSEATNAVAAE